MATTITKAATPSRTQIASRQRSSCSYAALTVPPSMSSSKPPAGNGGGPAARPLGRARRLTSSGAGRTAAAPPAGSADAGAATRRLAGAGASRAAPDRIWRTGPLPGSTSSAAHARHAPRRRVERTHNHGLGERQRLHACGPQLALAERGRTPCHRRALVWPALLRADQPWLSGSIAARSIPASRPLGMLIGDLESKPFEPQLAPAPESIDLAVLKRLADDPTSPRR